MLKLEFEYLFLFLFFFLLLFLFPFISSLPKIPTHKELLSIPFKVSLFSPSPGIPECSCLCPPPFHLVSTQPVKMISCLGWSYSLPKYHCFKIKKKSSSSRSQELRISSWNFASLARLCVEVGEVGVWKQYRRRWYESSVLKALCFSCLPGYQALQLFPPHWVPIPTQPLSLGCPWVLGSCFLVFPGSAPGGSHPLPWP